MNTESIVIGMMLNNPENLEKFLSLGIRPEIFSDVDARTIFSEIVRADTKGEPWDAIALCSRLNDLSLSVKVNRFRDLGHTTNPEHYATKLKGEHYALQVSTLATELGELAMNFREAPTELFSSLVNRKIEKLQAPTSSKDYSASAVMQRYQDYIDGIYGSEAPLGPKTGIEPLDALTGGLRAGSFWLIGARTGVGKTEFLCHLLLEASLQGFGSAFFTFEMLEHEILGRVLSRISGVNDGKIESKIANNSELDRLADAIRNNYKLPFHIIDDTSTSWGDLKLLIRTLVRRNGIRMVIIDYIQLLNSDGFRPSERVAELTQVSKQAKQLAKELGITIVFAAQLNRGAVQEDVEIELHHLKDCDSFAADANVVILMQREPDGRTKLKLQKNRGGKDKVNLYVNINFEKHTITGA